MNQTGIFIFVAVVIAFTIAGLFPGTKYTTDEAFQAQPFSPKDFKPDENLAQQNLQIDSFNFNPPACSANSKVAYYLVLDTSSSMSAANGNRIARLKTSVKNFSNTFNAETVVGVQRYSTDSRVVLGIGKYNKATFDPVIDRLGANGGTHMKAAMQLAKTTIEAARASNPDYSSYDWKLVFVSDGAPNPPTEDPRQIAKQIKDGSDVEIITVGLDLDKLTTKIDTETARTILKETASSPDLAYEPSANDLDKVLGQIAKNTCAAPAKQACTPNNQTKMELLVDNSGSMEDSMPGLKQALVSFSSKLSTNNIVGLHSFSGGGPRGVLQERFAIGNYDKARFETGVNRMSHDDEGATYIKDAFNLTKQKIDSYNKDPDYSKWTLIFLSDGNPKTLTGDDNDPSQDPKVIVQELKSKGMRIVSIALGDNLIKNRMKEIATDQAKDYFEAPTAAQLTDIYSRIFQSVGCGT